MLKEQCHCNMIGECRGKGDPLPAMGVREGPGLALGSHGRVGSLFLKSGSSPQSPYWISEIFHFLTSIRG